MESIDEFIKNIKQARKKASAFYKVDLHIHTHESYDYPCLGDKVGCTKGLSEEDEHPTQRDYITAAKQINDLRLIAITDHNKSRIAAELSKLSDRELVILPGMEVSLQASIFPQSQVHILAIFPERFSSEDIQGVFDTKCGMPRYDDRNKTSVSKTPVPDFIERVHSLGGICIASHVNSNKGIRTLFRENNLKLLQKTMRQKELERRKQKAQLIDREEAELNNLASEVKLLEDDNQNKYLEFLSTNEFDAIEVQKSDDRQYYCGTHLNSLGLRPISSLLSSDSHNLQDIGLASSTTYIKMTNPGYRDLRKALKDPGTRIRYGDTLHKHHAPQVVGLGFYGGFFQNQTLGFSDNLTCLIGGRGTGKSATIEALRYVFEQKIDHLPTEKRNDIDKRKEHTITNTTIRIQFVNPNGEQYILERHHGDQKSKCFDIEGHLLEEVDVSVNSSINVKIFGWGEIEELARNKREQLRLLDGFIENAQSYINAVNDSRQILETNTREIISLSSSIEQLLHRISELPAKEASLSRLNSDELNAIFSDFDKNGNARTSIDVIKLKLEEIREKFVNQNGQPFDLEKDIKVVIEAANPSINFYEWSNDFVATASEKATDFQNQYQNLLNRLADLEKLVSDKVELLDEGCKVIEGELNQRRREPGGEESEDISILISKRTQLSTEVTELRAIKKQIDEKQKRIEELLRIRYEEILPEIQQKRRELTQVRKAKVKEINKRLYQLSQVARVSVKLYHQKERESFRLMLGAPDPKAPDGIFKNVDKWYKKHDYAGLYSKRHSPHSFVQAILFPGDYSSLCVENLDDNGEIVLVIDKEKAKKVADHLSPYLEEGKPYFDHNKLEQILSLEHLDTEDLPEIRLGNKQIEELSPGQRCSTLIPIILLESKWPLIIDQPEDNLDNKLVFDLVVDTLRSLKEQRQIIVATHNPNIPVSGDAEQIIVFDSPSRERCDIVHQGSIDDEAIIEQIKTIMEGSEDAFRFRAEKYGYHLDFVK